MAKNDPIMAGVTLAAGAFGDPRFEYFAELMGYADADHARGKLAKLVSRATALKTDGYVPIKVVVYCLGQKAIGAIVEADLGELVEEGDVMRLKGSVRTEWMADQPERGTAGGTTRAQTAPRKGGRFVKSTTNPPATTSEPPSDQQDGDAGDSLDQQPPASPDQDQDQDLPDTHTVSSLRLVPEPSDHGGGDQAQPTALPDGWQPHDTDANLNAEVDATRRGVVVRPFALTKFLERSRAQRVVAVDWDAQWRLFLLSEFPTAERVRASLVEQRKGARAVLDRERVADATERTRAEADREEVQREWQRLKETGFRFTGGR